MKYVFCALMVLTLCSCGSGEKEKAAVVHGYYYFPKPNLYYDTADKNFIYFDSAAKKWEQGNLPPVFVQTELGKSILIDSAPLPVWAANKEHQLVYSAKLYADSSDFKKPPPPPKTVTRSSTETRTTDVDEEPKKKSKVGELLDRIFGGKKENN